ncbi:MAG TPA: NAD-binding protein [Acidobacteriota bacterium]|nr:NAD-binding protein [Acidobacteriota bacterium]
MKFAISTMTSLMLGSGRRSNFRLLLRYIAMLATVIIIYTVLFHILMVHEGQQHSWLTGFYWTLTVMSTLGFGDITFKNDIGRLFSIIVLLSGILFLLVMLPFTFIHFFYAPWLEAQNRARAPRALPPGTRGHVVLTHFNNAVSNLIARLEKLGVTSVILVPDLTQALDLFDQGYKVMVGELNHPDTYRKLNVHDAALVVVLNNDMESTNIIYTIRETCSHVVTVTNADHDDSLDILQLAGSTHVFQFHKMLGHALARRVLGTSLHANVIGGFDELLIAEIPAMATTLPSQTLLESRIRSRTGVNVVGVWKQGELLLPDPKMRIDMSSVLVLAGTEKQLDRFERLSQPPSPPGNHKGPVVILGGGRVGQAVADALEERGVDYRMVEKRGSLKQNNDKVIIGSAADYSTLLAAGIKHTPSIVITTHEDDLNLYLAIYCRRLRPDAQIISRASLNRNVTTLYRAGANLVMSYGSITTATISNLLHPGSLLMLSESLSVFRAAIDEQLKNRSLLELHVREETGCNVIAVKCNGKMIVNPEPSEVLREGEELILVGDTGSIDRFAAWKPSHLKKFISASKRFFK